MRIHIGSDHAGFETKQALVDELTRLGHDVIDHGPHAYDAQDDYPPFCLATGAGVVADHGSLGIVIGGSGNGEQMAANKVAGVRAALVWSVEIARLAREHNDANVLSLGGRILGEDLAFSVVDTFLSESFDGGRHARRVGQIAEIEKEECES